MASATPMSLQDILDEIYVNVDDDPTSSTTQDDEQTARIRLVNSGIRAWERQDVYWRELWTLYTGQALSNTNTYPIDASDFLQPGSLLYLTDASGNVTFIDVIDPTQAIRYAQNGESRAAYFTGNQNTGFTLNLTWTPTTGDNAYGLTYSFYYYKSASRLAFTNDIPEMMDSNYLVWYATAQKHLFNNRTDMAQDAMAQAQDCMDNMRIKNELMVNYGDNSLQDVEQFRYNDSLGR
jgi:hypothetical protein